MDRVLKQGQPEEAGLDPHHLRIVAQLMEEGIRTGIFTGAVLLIAVEGIVGHHAAYGHAQIVPSLRRMTLDTLFDLASLTKVTATLPVAMRLWDAGVLDLDAPVQGVIPEFRGGGRERVTPRHLLAHTSGLPAWRPLYLKARGKEEVLRVLCTIPLTYRPGEVVEYSDLGMILLGFLLERLAGDQLDRLFQRLVADPLELKDTMFTPPEELRHRCAATEGGNAVEREMAGEEGRDFPWRTHVLCGEVHDGNAHYALGGVAAHAGLFSTAEEVATIAQEWIRPSGLFSQRALIEATGLQTCGAEGPPRGLGWVLHHPGAFFAAFGKRAFGHTGFTGTSVACDPEAGVVAVLLTNRVHPRGDHDAIEQFRPHLHAAIRKALMT
jgi:CubicO group peptidase (beta-lactamase class C family)